MKSILSILFFSVIALQGISQNRYGIMAGAVFSDMVNHGEFSGSDDFFNSFHTGVYFQRDLGDWGYIRVGAAYLEKGFRDKGEVETEFGNLPSVWSYTTKISLEYIQVPISIGIKTRLEGLSFEFGSGFGYLLDARRVGKSSYSPGEQNPVAYNRLVLDDYQRMELSGNVGLSYAFQNGLLLSCRLERSITRVSKGDFLPSLDPLDPPRDIRRYNQNLVLTLGYFFERKNK